jgi:lipocalin-like protein
MKAVRDRLIGSWELIEYETRDAAGRRAHPYGAAAGRLTYDDRGNMSGQVMRPDRARVENAPANPLSVRGAYYGYIAYFGTYEVAPDGASVVHQVEGALNPEWVGGQQVRTLRFDGDRLVLGADVNKHGEIVTHVLTWERR